MGLLAATVSAFTPFWTPQIDSALRVRDAYFKAILPDPSNYSFLLLSAEQQGSINAKLATVRDTASPWHDFCTGLLKNAKKDSSATSTYFGSAITRAQSDPGATWALFVEFTRNRQTVWAERCLMHLEKILLASGARSAPAIAQQLLYYAYEFEKQKDYANAFSYYAWAERFDPNQLWSVLHRMRRCIPMHPKIFFASLSTIVSALYDSWSLQLSFVQGVYIWLRYLLLIFIIAVFTGLSVRHLSEAVHFIADRLPKNIPLSFKTALPIAVILSFVSFGLIPFLWLIAFLIWRFLDKKETVLFSVALVLLLSSPFDARVQDMFIQSRSPQGSIALFNHASQEGYSPEIQRFANDKIAANGSDLLAQEALMLCSFKQGDSLSAVMNAQKSLAIRPDDPVVLVNAGNAAFAKNDFTVAANYYQQAIAQRNDDMCAQFNISQCSARRADLPFDLDFMKILSSGDQATVANFHNANTMYFTRNWPLLRQVMIPDYEPNYFWAHLFPYYNGSWKTACAVWGSSFFGLSPKTSLIVFAALFIALIAFNASPVVRRRKEAIGSCRICKRTTCGKCKKNEMCPSCSRATQYIRNVKTLAAIQARLKRNRLIMASIGAHALDICLPGSGMLFSGRYPLWRCLFVIFLTSAVYAGFFVISSLHPSYPNWLAYGLIEKSWLIFVCYNAIFLIRALVATLRRKGAVLA
jgi:hypothetical protein